MQVHFWVVLDILASACEQSLLTAHCKCKQCSASTCSWLLPLPYMLCHADPHSLHSADSLQDSSLGYKRSLLVWVKIKLKTSKTSLLTSQGPFQHQLVQSINLYIWWLFLGSSSGSSYRGSAVGIGFSLGAVQERERCLHITLPFIPLITLLYMDISFFRSLLQFISINAVAC